MNGVYGYDIKTGLYWWHVRYMGVQVDSGKGLTRTQIEDVKKKNSFVSWSRDYDYAF